jgi:ribonuclease HII
MLERFYTNDTMEAGIDEAGRGPLFGRVYTATVILSPEDNNFNYGLIKDSKKYTNYNKLLEAYEHIKEHALDYSISWVDEREIDSINIRNATYKSMHKAIDKLDIKPDILLVDGNDFIPYIKIVDEDDFFSIPHQCIIKGDNTYPSIAAASILAKVERDKYILEMCKQHPNLINYYKIDKNKGYGSKDHIEGIKRYGITQFHRRTFGICKKHTSISQIL